MGSRGGGRQGWSEAQPARRTLCEPAACPCIPHLTVALLRHHRPQSRPSLATRATCRWSACTPSRWAPALEAVLQLGSQAGSACHLCCPASAVFAPGRRQGACACQSAACFVTGQAMLRCQGPDPPGPPPLPWQVVGTLKMNGTARTGAFTADGTQLMTSGGDGTGEAPAGRPRASRACMGRCLVSRAPARWCGAASSLLHPSCCYLPTARLAWNPSPPPPNTLQCTCGTCARSAACSGTRTRGACREPAWRARQTAPSLPRVGARPAARGRGSALPARPCSSAQPSLERFLC